MSKDALLNQIHFENDIPHVPFGLALAISPTNEFDGEFLKRAIPAEFSPISRESLQTLAFEIGKKDLKFHKESSGRPFALDATGTRYGVSISHTKSMYACCLSESRNIGLDVEHCNRVVTPRLRNRIMHPLEMEKLKISVIRLWTIKEAVLKLNGTGLRVNMSDIHTKRVTDSLFEARLKDHLIKVVSIKKMDHWFSIAFN
ncbi:MAG: 4'-phosphopantetheinyl transferase superfamily protein [Balneolales bacterium]|nr:4'-phosphopantetheinyl transferase superfamily protein [Balneolales bacterium]